VIQDVKTIVDLSRSYRQHAHHELSVVHVWSGAALAWFDGSEVQVAGECVVVIPAGVPHACNPVKPGDWSYTLALMDTMNLPKDRSHHILPSSPGLRRAFSALRAGADPQAIEGLGTEILLGLRDSMAGEALLVLPHCRPGALRMVEAYLRTHSAAPLTLDDLGALSGISKFHLLRSFRSEYGLTPHAYLLNLRVNAARQRLRGGAQPAQVALDCGFYDQSHLTRAFARCVGMTPAAYQKAAAIPSKTSAIPST